jgi:uncharacterized protein (DUF736 family)
VRRALPLVCLAAAGVLAAQATAANAPIRRHTAKDMTLARRALVRKVEVGKGWTAVKASAASSLTCKAFDPSMAGIVETGAAAVGYRGPAEVISQVAWVYRSSAQAATLWRRVVRKGLLDCLEAAGRSAGGLTVTKLQSGELAVPKLAQRTAGYRLIVTAKAKNQTIDLYYDSFLLGPGKTVTQIMFGAGRPVPSAVELAVARAVAKRLGTAGAA